MTLIFPRTAVSDTGSNSSETVTSIRALIDLNSPTGFHRELLAELRIPDGARLADISRLWHEKFSVERVTTRFYKEYASVRDRMADTLLKHNQDHPVIQQMANDEARAWPVDTSLRRDR